MATLLLAEHDNKSLKDATNKALTAAKADGRRRACAGRGLRREGRRGCGRQARWRRQGAARGRAGLRACARRAARRADRLARRRLRCDRCARDHDGEERHAARRGPARRDADLRHHQGGGARHVRAADLCRQRDPDREVEGREEGHHGAHLDLPGDRRGRLRARSRTRPRRPIRAFRSFVGEELSKSERPELTSAKIIISGGRAMQIARELHQVHRAGRRQARRRGRRLARRGRCRLCAERLAGRPDRQGGGAGTLHRGRHLRRDPASRRHEGLQGDRGDQQGRGGADLPGRRLRPGRRPLSGAAGACRTSLGSAGSDRGLSR